MNNFNTTIQIKVSVDEESDEIGSTFQGWANRGDPMRAEKTIIRGKIEEVANREQSVMYCRFKIRACNIARTIDTTDRLSDLYGTTEISNGLVVTSPRVHDVLNVYEDAERRFIMIETRSYENQAVYA